MLKNNSLWEKIRSKLFLEYKLLDTIGIEVAFEQFLRDFIFRGDQKISESIEYRKQEKIKKHIKKNFDYVIEKYKEISFVCNENETVNLPYIPVWVFWAQGFEQSPPIVKICHEQLKRITSKKSDEHFYKLIELDLNNYDKYVDIPEYIIQKYKLGTLSIINFSDILRVTLLSKWGGLWVDATLLLTDLPKVVSDLQFFTVKHRLFKEDEHICKGLWSTFFLSGKKHCLLFEFLKDMFFEYTKHYDFFLSYFLIDILIGIGYDEIPEIKRIIDLVPDNNSQVFHLFNMLSFDKKNEYEDYIRLFKSNYIHKLSYKGNNVNEIEKKLIYVIQKSQKS